MMCSPSAPASSSCGPKILRRLAITEMETHDPTRSVLGRAFAILQMFHDGSEQTLPKITAGTGLAPATVYRMLAEMVEWGALERTGRGRYRIGLRLWQLGSQAPEGRELRDLALPFLQDLFEVTHEVVHLVVLDHDVALYLEKLEARPGVAVVSQVARALPLHATGPGKVLLAYSSQDYVDQIISAGLKRYASKTITKPAVLLQALADIRQNGFCLSRDEMTEGASSIAAPVRDGQNTVTASISVVVPSSTPNLAPLVPAVRVAALGISRELKSRRYLHRNMSLPG
jgi:DNA-binding IclR family transcriptional regulator